MKLEAYVIQKIRNEMSARGLVNSDLAEMSGVPIWTIIRIFQRESAKMSDIDKILSALHMTLEVTKE